MQTVVRLQQGDVIQKVSFTDDKHKPSWKRFGDGWANIEFTTHRDRKYLSIVATEHSREGRGTSKAVYVTLDEPAAAELLKHLTAILTPALD